MGKRNKEIATAQELIKDLEFDTQPLDISISQSGILNDCLSVVVLVNNTITFKKNEEIKDFPIITIYGFERVFDEELSIKNYKKEVEININASDIFLILNKLNSYIDNGPVTIEIDKIVSSSMGLLIYSTVKYFNKIVTYQFLISEWALENHSRIYNTTVIQEYNDESTVERVSAVSSSSDLSTISIILGKNYHIVLKEINSSNGHMVNNNDKYKISLRNYTRFTNNEDKRTLYSTVSSKGNRIIVSDRDERVKLRNNSNVTNLGTINSLVYDYKKEEWIFEDRFYEVNVNIRNIGEHIDINDNGDGLVTTCIYNPINTEEIKEVIYLLNRNNKGKWKRLARGVIGNNITNISLLNDSNILLAETTVKVDKEKTIKKLNCLFRDNDNLVNQAMVDSNGIYRQICLKDEYTYIGFIRFRSDVWDGAILAKNSSTNKYHLFTLKCIIADKYEHNKLDFGNFIFYPEQLRKHDLVS